MLQSRFIAALSFRGTKKMDGLKLISSYRRICSGKFYTSIFFDGEDFDIVFTDPNLDLSTEADWIYQKVYNRCVDEDILTVDKAHQLLIDEGKWSPALDAKLDNLEKYLKKLNGSLPKAKFKKTQEKVLIDAIAKCKLDIQELNHRKGIYDEYTAEYIADKARRRYLVSRISNIIGIDNDIANTLKSNINFLDTILVLYYGPESMVPEESIRLIARSGYFRTLWSATKSIGSRLFSYELYDITDLQYMLLHWAQIYDYAFNHQNRPSDEVIDDDYKFDAWLQQEQEITKAEISRAAHQDRFGTVGQDVYIPADREGAKSVYELNDQYARKKVQQRQKMIEEKGMVSELEFTDIKQEVRMLANQAGSAAMQSRTKVK